MAPLPIAKVAAWLLAFCTPNKLRYPSRDETGVAENKQFLV